MIIMKNVSIQGFKCFKKGLLFILFTCHLSLIALFGCGYSIQRQANLPFDSISIGKIENRTVEPKLQDKFQRILTETFMEYGFRIEPLSRYVIEGSIISFDLKPLSEKSLIVTEYEVIIKANFILLDTKTNERIPINIRRPFVTYFDVLGRIEDILMHKEIATNRAIKDISLEITRSIIYSEAMRAKS